MSTIMQRRRRLASLINREGGSKTGCIEWQGASNPVTGYGQYRTDSKNWSVHRMLWETFVGDVPEGYEIHHKCENRLCINPMHLECVEAREHWWMGNSPSAQRAHQTHCKNGHALTPENTYVRTKTGHRRCRICHAASERARKERST